MENDLQDKVISLTIDFSRILNEKEQNDFWDELIDLIGSMNLFAGGGKNTTHLEWCIDYSNSQLKKGDIIERINNFVFDKNDIIMSFNIE
jgi:hypothetical protein